MSWHYFLISRAQFFGIALVRVFKVEELPRVGLASSPRGLQGPLHGISQSVCFFVAGQPPGNRRTPGLHGAGEDFGVFIVGRDDDLPSVM